MLDVAVDDSGAAVGAKAEAVVAAVAEAGAAGAAVLVETEGCKRWSHEVSLIGAFNFRRWR